MGGGGRGWSCGATQRAKSSMRGRCGDFRRVSKVLRFVPIKLSLAEVCACGRESSRRWARGSGEVTLGGG